MTTNPHPTPQLFVRLPHSWAGASLDAIERTAAAAEELGFDGISVQDHVLSGPAVSPNGGVVDGDDRTVFESLSTLAYIAGRTSRVKLLTGVLVLPFRHVIWVAKAAAAIDLFSHGRLILGVGVGAPVGRADDAVQNIGPHSSISARETVLFDLPGPRGRIMDEQLAALDALWTQDAASFAGEFVAFSGIDLHPKPAQRPRPPIWVGGRADAALRRAATLADGWFPSQASVEVIAEGRAKVLAWAAEAGRPEPVFGVNLFVSVGPDGDAAREIVRRGLGHRFKTEAGLFANTMAGTPAEIVARIEAYRAVGCSSFDLKLLPLGTDDTLASMRLLAAEVLPAVRG